MTCDTVFLRPDDESVYLKTYISYDPGEVYMKPRRSIIICPGGAYEFLSEREAEPVAKAFMAAGFNAFILYYSIGESAVFPRPLVDASLAVCHIKDNAEKYNINPDMIFVCGFSAGGHLAGAIGTLWDRDYAKASPDMPYGKNKVRGMILSYAVITSGEFAHRGCINNILGTSEPSDEQLCAYSLEKQVTKNTVPAFLWHTANDDCVPVENSLLMAKALSNNKIPFELHVYPIGCHGLSVATRETSCQNAWMEDRHIATWVRDAIEWTDILC